MLANKLEAMILSQEKEWPTLEKKEDEDYTVVTGKKGRRGKGNRANEVQGKSKVVVAKSSLTQSYDRVSVR